jgi:hypothetical protein
LAVDIRPAPDVTVVSMNRVERAYELGVNSYPTRPVNEDAMTALVANLGLYWLVLDRDPADPEG